jgi:hypothetical protein
VGKTTSPLIVDENDVRIDAKDVKFLKLPWPLFLEPSIECSIHEKLTVTQGFFYGLYVYIFHEIFYRIKVFIRVNYHKVDTLLHVLRIKLNGVLE